MAETRTRTVRVAALAGVAAGMFAASGARAEVAPSVDALRELSIEQLGSLEVTSVSKRSESLRDAPAAIYVITADDIRRSGAKGVAEILRLAPNLEIFQTSAGRYVITARGFNGAPASQNFSNKLLVLIDGRTVYSPLFSGVYWDMQSVMAEDIERIEVISGPGATLWGANAVNGVINITTRHTAETLGAFASATVGTEERSAALRIGGRMGEAVTWRVYAKALHLGDTEDAAGKSLNDHWSIPQVGFRFDWQASPVDAVTVQGDAYDGYEAQRGVPAEDLIGHNLTTRWVRTLGPDSSLQVQAFYDRVQRGFEIDGGAHGADTWDIDLQHSFKLGSRQDIVWGGGVRRVHYRVTNAGGLQFEPPAGTLKLANAFIQDTVALTPKLKLIVGAKVEDDAYVKPQFLPNVRVSWTPNDGLNLWGAVSRAIRSPTPFDHDVAEYVGGVRFLIGGADFRSEKLTAYELGARIQPSRRLTLSVSTFYNVYDDLRSIEITPKVFLPLIWGNGMRGHTYGVEAWGAYEMASWWRMSASFNVLEEKFKFKPGASGLSGVSQAADDPKYQASLKSSMNLGSSVTLDAALRYVSALPDPRTPSYVEMNGRLAWAVNPRLEVALAGRNLLHDGHAEYPGGARIPRSVFAELRARF